MKVDGIPMVEGYRIMLIGQPRWHVRWRHRLANWWRRVRGKPERDYECNGIYTVTAVGSAKAPWTIQVPVPKPPGKPKVIVLSQEAVDQIEEGIRREAEGK
jgi:hypothetical protein